MTIEYQGTRIPASFASCSITNKDGESLLHKMDAIKSAGFDGMELAMPDIIAYGNSINGARFDENDIDAVVATAILIRRLASHYGLRILMLQPFSQFEGWLGHRREDALQRAAQWLRIMEGLGTDLLQVGSSNAHDISFSQQDIVRDLRQLADMCANKGYRVAYENWCWSTHAPTWKDVWELVRLVDRDNFGLCLDTFQAAGAEYADPSTESGLQECMSRDDLDDRWCKSLAELSKIVRPAKIFVLQISDACKMTPPITGTDQPKSDWSHGHRPLPYQRGYLPVEQVLNAVLATGFRGWLSVEVFDPSEESRVRNAAYTTTAMEALERLVERCRPG